jgi:hypothetical protein
VVEEHCGRATGNRGQHLLEAGFAADGDSAEPEYGAPNMNGDRFRAELPRSSPAEQIDVGEVPGVPIPPDGVGRRDRCHSRETTTEVRQAGPRVDGVPREDDEIGLLLGNEIGEAALQSFRCIGVDVADLCDADGSRSCRQTRHFDPHVDDLGPVRLNEPAVGEARNPRRGETQSDASDSQRPRREGRERAVHALAYPANDRPDGQHVHGCDDDDEYRDPELLVGLHRGILRRRRSPS